MKISPRTRDWLIAFIYVGCIYVTLDVAPLPVAALRSYGMLRITLATVFFSTLAFLFALLSFRKKIPLWRFAALLLLAGSILYASRWTNTPEEQIHFLEYAVVGIFFLRAVSHNTKTAWKQYLWAFTLAFLAGALDESLQGLSRTRHFDFHDIFLNGFSALIGLAAHATID